ncbi:MAG: hypothetical protein MZV70_12805 [Desulfobacterales bacterium]|nr:hypothetical protein [Desulfobacterales bacterium]
MPGQELIPCWRRHRRTGGTTGPASAPKAASSACPADQGRAQTRRSSSCARRITGISMETHPEAPELSRALRRIVLEGCGDYLAAETPAAIFESFSRFRVLCALRDGPYGADALNAAIEGILAREGRIAPGRPWYEGRARR